MGGGSSNSRRFDPTLNASQRTCLQIRRHMDARRCARGLQPAVAAGCRYGCRLAAAALVADSAAGKPMRLWTGACSADLRRADVTAVLRYSTPARPSQKLPHPGMAEMPPRHAVGSVTCAQHHVRGSAAAGTHIRGASGCVVTRSGFQTLQVLSRCGCNRTALPQLHPGSPTRPVLSAVASMQRSRLVHGWHS